ncbi:MAG: hypothetical protein CM1200mP41_29410 [Gammaproteobacteria bacterium]|nr:MAG: hypothetical protein CM1200mP41_29410 [Gammaproteobacteria bacterium]
MCPRGDDGKSSKTREYPLLGCAVVLIGQKMGDAIECVDLQDHRIHRRDVFPVEKRLFQLVLERNRSHVLIIRLPPHASVPPACRLDAAARVG